ncbi:NAD(P)/FAD-dependent oxidoreductase [Knoellia sp. CPCC 206450]|uniref:NAD(P)/FAD-dependent oxidoreductase n=1 Tax=Knoellia tibetensis TaxID=3404798 RepID=UPI003B42CD1B
MYDALVIGGGPAGLQAALTLGRMHRPTLLLDSGSYRNAAAEAVHNLVTGDGRPPKELRTDAVAELTAYEAVELREVAATVVRRREDGTFVADLEDGSQVAARTVVLATGVRDVMPDVPGFTEQWGRTVHVCPFCHGHELAGRRVAVEGGTAAAHLVAIFEPIAARVEVVPTVTAVEMTDAGLRVTTTSGEVVVDGLFTHPDVVQAAPFADQLGLELRESGCIAIDVNGNTSVRGVLAAGDAAHVADMEMPVQSVLAAAYAGQVAAASALGLLVLPVVERVEAGAVS